MGGDRRQPPRHGRDRALADADERVGRAPLPLDAGDGLAPVERALLDRVRGLRDGDAHRAAGRRRERRRASSGRSSPPRARSAAGGASLEVAEAAGVVELRGDRLRFAHPLLRRAVYAATGAGERRTAHRALADALPAESADARAWHPASAAVGPDEAIAAALESTAQLARARLGYAAAQRALERAADLSAGADDARPAPARGGQRRGARRPAAAGADAARPRGAQRAARRARAATTSRCAAAWRPAPGRASEAHELLVREAARLARRAEPARAARLYADAVLPALRAGLRALRSRPASRPRACSRGRAPATPT